jgi:hypothetical protein
MEDIKIVKALLASKWGKPVLTILGTIFLGALGSGLWDVFLRDLMNLLAFSLLKIVGTVYAGYLDNLHAEIARGCIDRFSSLPYLVVVVFFCSFPWAAISLMRLRLRYFEKQYVESRQSSEVSTADEVLAYHKNLIRKFTIILSIFAIFMSTAYVTLAARDFYANNGAIYLDRSIEIVAPYISASDVLRLRAAFRSIKSTDDFHKLDSELKSIAKKTKVELPKFRSLEGRDKGN